MPCWTLRLCVLHTSRMALIIRSLVLSPWLAIYSVARPMVGRVWGTGIPLSEISEVAIIKHPSTLTRWPVRAGTIRRKRCIDTSTEADGGVAGQIASFNNWRTLTSGRHVSFVYIIKDTTEKRGDCWSFIPIYLWWLGDTGESLALHQLHLTD